MISVQISETAAAALNAQAAAQGLTLQAYLENIAQIALPSPTPRLTVEELDRLLDEEASTGPSPSGTFSRADIYSDHD